MKASVETRQTRGATKAASELRRAAAHDRARTCIRRLNTDLEGQDSEFAAEVLRAIVRTIGMALVARIGVGRAVGVLVGTLNAISPAWRSDASVAHAEAEALFAGEAG